VNDARRRGFFQVLFRRSQCVAPSCRGMIKCLIGVLFHVAHGCGSRAGSDAPVFSGARCARWALPRRPGDRAAGGTVSSATVRGPGVCVGGQCVMSWSAGSFAAARKRQIVHFAIRGLHYCFSPARTQYAVHPQ